MITTSLRFCLRPLHLLANCEETDAIALDFTARCLHQGLQPTPFMEGGIVNDQFCPSRRIVDGIATDLKDRAGFTRFIPSCAIAAMTLQLRS